MKQTKSRLQPHLKAHVSVRDLRADEMQTLQTSTSLPRLRIDNNELAKDLKSNMIIQNLEKRDRQLYKIGAAAKSHAHLRQLVPESKNKMLRMNIADLSSVTDY